jgi:hypothetical protein
MMTIRSRVAKILLSLTFVVMCSPSQLLSSTASAGQVVSACQATEHTLPSSVPTPVERMDPPRDFEVDVDESQVAISVEPNGGTYSNNRSGSEVCWDNKTVYFGQSGNKACPGGVGFCSESWSFTSIDRETGKFETQYAVIVSFPQIHVPTDFKSWKEMGHCNSFSGYLTQPTSMGPCKSFFKATSR